MVYIQISPIVLIISFLALCTTFSPLNQNLIKDQALNLVTEWH